MSDPLNSRREPGRHPRAPQDSDGPIHDGEVDTSEDVVRSLLAEQFPSRVDSALTHLRSSGTTNTLWYLETPAGEPNCVIRLPRTPGAEPSVVDELDLLPALASTDLAAAFRVPKLLHRGRPGHVFPLHWMVLEWIDGQDAWEARHDLARNPTGFVDDMVNAVRMLSTLGGLPVAARKSGERGGPLGPLLERLDRWLDDPQWAAEDLLDTDAVRRVAARSAEVIDEPVATGFVHGDLIPGNVLIADSRLSAIIDWGGAGQGDRAQDLCPAWALFDGPARAAFRDRLEVDEATWLRARAFELEHAVSGVLYYRPKGHLLGDVMARTLGRILTDG